MKKKKVELVSTDVENFIGRVGRPSGYAWTDEVIAQKTISRKPTLNNKSDKTVLVYFKNGATVNSRTVSWKKLEEKEEPEYNKSEEKEDGNRESK